MPKRVVVDANVLVKWFVPEDYSDLATVIMNDHLYGVVTIVAPSYAILEFTNTLRKYVVKGILSESDAINALRLLKKMEVEYVPITFDVVEEALSYAFEKGITVYDAYYILLAKKYDAKMYTADEKLLKRIGREEESVKHIKDYTSDRLI